MVLGPITEKDIKLTDLEMQVALLRGEGLSYKEIARELNTSEGYVKNRMNTACNKMGARTTTHLAVMIALKVDRERRSILRQQNEDHNSPGLHAVASERRSDQDSGH